MLHFTRNLDHICYKKIKLKNILLQSIHTYNHQSFGSTSLITIFNALVRVTWEESTKCFHAGDELEKLGLTVNGLLTKSICDFSLIMSHWQFNKKLSDHGKLFQLSLRMSAQHFTPLHPAVVGIFPWLADRCTDWHLLPLKLRRKLAWLKMNCQSRAPEAELSWLDHTFTVMQQDPPCLVNAFHTIGTQTFCKKKCVVSLFAWVILPQEQSYL